MEKLRGLKKIISKKAGNETKKPTKKMKKKLLQF